MDPKNLSGLITTDGALYLYVLCKDLSGYSRNGIGT